MTQPRHSSTAANAHSEPITQNGATNLTLLCAQVYAQIQAFINADASTDLLRAVQEQSRLTLKILDEALERYGLEELSLSYNGGKDCLVLLVLYLAALHTYSKKSGFSLPDRLHTVYIVSSHPFEEVETFVESSASMYHLELVRYAKPMKQAFEEYLQDRQQVKAIFVGTRRTDPHGGSLKYFDPTDGGWPSFMRIHPVIDWHYSEIWGFIRHLDIPYCKLYDMGYTSLGGTTDTHPNPALRLDGDIGNSGFRPAYELVEDGEERLGRDH